MFCDKRRITDTNTAQTADQTLEMLRKGDRGEVNL
jgi:hypothetical protein